MCRYNKHLFSVQPRTEPKKLLIWWARTHMLEWMSRFHLTVASQTFCFRSVSFNSGSIAMQWMSSMEWTNVASVLIKTRMNTLFWHLMHPLTFPSPMHVHLIAVRWINDMDNSFVDMRTSCMRGRIGWIDAKICWGSMKESWSNLLLKAI